jgi:hypothetical protein
VRYLASLLVVALVLACGSGGSGNGPCTLTAIGAPCNNDTDCCSNYCMLYDDMVTACQAKPGIPQACVDMNGYCTQNRNCCSGLCMNNACFGGAPTGSCLSLGSTCIQDDSCCSNNCVNDGMGNTECATQPQPDSGPTCGFPGSPCSMPGQADPAECCFGGCSPLSTCSGGTGPGMNCGQAGAYCQFGTDCCSGVCEQLASTSACH